MSGADQTETFLPTDYKPYTVLKDLVTPEEIAQVKEFFHNCKEKDPLVNISDYSHVVLDTRLHLPSLEAKLNALFPDMMVFATNFFSGDSQNGVYSGWHTGANLSKLFVGEPETCTVWIPLQTLTAETGGRLWFYNSEYLDSVIDVLRVTSKKTQIFQFLMLQLLEKDLEANKVRATHITINLKITEDCQLGDAFMFWEINPHCVDRDCNINREILSVRLVSKDAVVDEQFIKELEELPEDEPINLFEEKKTMMRLHGFLLKTKATFENSKAILKARENQQ